MAARTATQAPAHLLARVLLGGVPRGHAWDLEALVFADVAGGGDVGAVARVCGVWGREEQQGLLDPQTAREAEAQEDEQVAFDKTEM